MAGDPDKMSELLASDAKNTGKFFQLPSAPGKKPVSAALALIEMRRYVLERVHVIDNLIDVANGRLPDAWKNALQKPDPVDPTGTRMLPLPGLTLQMILDANYAFLRRLMPEYRQVELSAGDGMGSTPGFEQARAAMTAALVSAVVSHGGKVDTETGAITLPEGVVFKPVIDGEAIHVPDVSGATDLTPNAEGVHEVAAPAVQAKAQPDQPFQQLVQSGARTVETAQVSDAEADMMQDKLDNGEASQSFDGE